MEPMQSDGYFSIPGSSNEEDLRSLKGQEREAVLSSLGGRAGTDLRASRTHPGLKVEEALRA